MRWIATQTSKHECAAIHDKLQRAAVPGTGEWLLDHPLFRDWSDQRGPSGLWISGKWGTGKSVLASNIIRRLMDRCRTDDSMACAYIYCSSEYPFLSSDANKNADVANAISYKRVLGSLLHQLYGALPLDQDLDSLVTLWGQGASLLEVHVEQALRDVMPMFQQAFVVIDGLDEFQRTDDGEFAVLCEFIGTLVESAGPSILILSRPEYLDISNAMADSAVIQIDGKANEDDIITFVHEQTSRLGRMGRYEDQIRTELVVRANGVFRWISAVVSYIRHIKTPRARAEAVKTMPPHLKDVYAKTLERILNQTDIAYNYAVMALLWTAHATLSVKEMTEALSIEPGMTSIDDDDRIDPGHVDELCENCQGFLELSSSGRYQLPHDSVRDFLVGPPDPRHQGLEAFWTLRAQTDERIAEACLTYLSLDVFSDVKVTSRKQVQELHHQYPLLRFASHHWGDHVAKLGDSVPPPLQRLVRAFLESDNRRELNLQLLRDDDLAGFFTTLKSQDRFVFRCARTSVPLHLVAWFGLEHFLPEYMSDEAFHSRDGFSLLPIDLATLQQKHKVFDSMLGHFDRELDGTRKAGGVGPTQNESDTGGKDAPQDEAIKREPFYPLLLLPYVLATRETWVPSLRKILDLGFDPNAVEPTGFAALHAAAGAGNVGGVEVLLKMGADPSARGPDGQTPFLIAAYNRERAVVRALLDHGGFDISADGSLGFNALHYFSEYDHELAAEYLRRGGKIESSETGRTPLHFAASASNTDSVRVLCRWLRGISEERLRAELAKQRSDGITALQVAAVTGSVDVVKVLVEQFGDDLMALTPAKETMLHLGAMSDEPNLIDFLIERCGIAGLDPNAQRSDSATALHIAVARGHANFVTALLKAFPNLNTGLRDKFGRVPLYTAALSGDIKMVEMLKDHGYDVPNRDGSLPFNCAVRNGHLDCVKALYRPEILERPVSTSGQTALHDAAAMGHTDVVRFLLAVGHRHSLRDNLGRSPLHVGVLFGNLAVVCLLLESGSDIRCLDTDARTPLSNAFWVWPAQPKVVSLLLGEERDLLNFQDEFGRNCAHICAGRGTPELWAEVWPRGYLAKSPDLTEQNLVAVAASFGNLPMLEYLVETDGVAFDVADICGRTPLFWAVKNGFIHVVKKLLELGADVHLCDNQGRTPMHLAIIAGYPRITQALLAAGSDHMKRDRLGLSVKDYAKRYWRFAEIFWHWGPGPVAEDDVNHVEMLCSFVASTARELAAHEPRKTRGIVKKYTYQAPREALALALFELDEDADAVVLASELISRSDLAIRCRICKMRSWGKMNMLRCGDCADVYLCQSCFRDRYFDEETKGDYSIVIDRLDVQSQLVAQALWPFVRLDAPGIQFLLRSDPLFSDWVSETYTAYAKLFDKHNTKPDSKVLPGAWALVGHLESILNATGGESGGSSKSSPRKLDDLTASFHRFYACSGPFDDPSAFPCRGHKFVRVPLLEDLLDGPPDGVARFITGQRTNVAYYTYLAAKYAPGSEEYELLVSGEKETRWSGIPYSDSSAFGNYHENYDYDNSTWLDEESDRSVVVEDGDGNEVEDDSAERSGNVTNPQHPASAEPECERVLSGEDTLLSVEEGTDAPERIVDSLQDLEDATLKSESEDWALGTAPKGANLDSKEPTDGVSGTAVQQHSHEDVEHIEETGGGNSGAEDDEAPPPPQQGNMVVGDDIPPDNASVQGHVSLADDETSGNALRTDTPWIPAAVYEKLPISGPKIIVSLGSDRNSGSATPKTRSGSTSDSLFIPVGSVTSSSSSSSSTSNGTFRSSSTFDAYPIDQFLADMDWWENPFPVEPLPKQKGVITNEAIEFTETKWKLAKAVLASRHRDNQNAVIDWMRIRGFEVIVTERGQEAWQAALEQFQAPRVGGRLNPYRPRSEPIPGWFTNHVRACLGQPPAFLFPTAVVVEGPGSREGSVRSGDVSEEWLPPLSEPNLRAHQSRRRFQQESSNA